MAKTISFSAALAIIGDGINANLSGSGSASQAGADTTFQTQSIGFAAAELLDIGSDNTVPGYLMVKNLDATNFVELSLNDFTQKWAKLRPGEFCLVPPSTFTLYAKADTAACVVAIIAIEL